MRRLSLLFILLTSLTFAAVAQKPDTSVTKKNRMAHDTLVSTKSDTDITRAKIIKPKKEKVYHPDSTHSVHTAIMRSAIVPGLGQIYNRKYWKVPLIYAGLGTVAYYLVWNINNYNKFARFSHFREFAQSPDPTDPLYAEYQLYNAAHVPDQSIYDQTDYYRRNRDLLVLGFVGGWLIQVVDAYIDAKFINSYSIDNNLSIRITPGLINQPAYAQNFTGSYIPGIKITFALK